MLEKIGHPREKLVKPKRFTFPMPGWEPIESEETGTDQFSTIDWDGEWSWNPVGGIDPRVIGAMLPAEPAFSCYLSKYQKFVPVDFRASRHNFINLRIKHIFERLK